MILLAYLIISLSYSEKQGWWHDEIYSMTFLSGVSAYTFENSTLPNPIEETSSHKINEIVQNGNLANNLYRQLVHEGHPPLYFLTIKGWSLLFGKSELGLRSFSVFCGLITILIFYGLINKITKDEILKCLFITCVISNPFFYYFNNEARMYALTYLLASSAFYYWIKMRSNGNNGNRTRFIISSFLLLLSHYYGVFFIATLGTLHIIQTRKLNHIFIYAIPVIIFSPWALIIQEQLASHSAHWTDGSLNILLSYFSFMYGVIHLFISPVSEINFIELIITCLILIVPLFLSKSKELIRSIVISLFTYGSLIYLFDLIVDHHTIAIPRYYMPITIILYWYIFKSINILKRSISSSLLITQIIVGLIVIIQIFNLDRAPKQMFREVAAYIEMKYHPDEAILVLEQGGPLAFGLSYYLIQNYQLVSSIEYNPNDPRKMILIQENLGLDTEISGYNFIPDSGKKLIMVPFVGINLYEE
jgi:uncharacterized membrane protein